MLHYTALLCYTILCHVILCYVMLQIMLCTTVAYNAYHVKWVAYHHGMECHQDVDAGDAAQIRKAADNVSNKVSRTFDSVPYLQSLLRTKTS